MEINDTNFKSFLSVTSKENLLHFLTSRRHPFYHHFTNFSTLEKKLKGKSWVFTPSKSKNDYHEYDSKSDRTIRDNILSTSFSWGDEDNMAMWSMYCVPREDAVRITFNEQAMERWLQVLQQKMAKPCNDVIQWSQNRDAQTKKQMIPHSELENKIEAIFLHDIVYFLGYQNRCPGNKLCWGGIEQPAQENLYVNDVLSFPETTGFVKNSAWNYEQESRLSIYFNGIPEAPYLLEFSDADWNFILRNSEIAFGPWTPLFRFEERKNQILGWIDNEETREHLNRNMRNSFFSARVKMSDNKYVRSPRKIIMDLLDETICHADVYRCDREMIPDGGRAQFVREMQLLVFQIDNYNQYFLSKRKKTSNKKPCKKVVTLVSEFIEKLESNRDDLGYLYPTEVIDELKTTYLQNE